MKVQKLQELIESPNLEGSGQEKTQAMSGLGSTRDARCPTGQDVFFSGLPFLKISSRPRSLADRSMLHTL
jgi:hypothetical protein